MSIKTTTIYDLKVCSIKEPYGVDENPVFSWKMRSDVLGQKQSAYMIELKKARCKNDEMVWNTGKVFSDESMFVSCGVPLEPMTAYDWTLTVWDKDDNALESQSSRFVTGVIDQNWNNAKWLTVYDQTTEYKDITDYTIETSFILIKNETNFLIATGSHLHYYRFRFFVSGEALLLESYWYAPDGDYRRCGEQINVSELLAILPEEINTLELQLRFCVSPDEIITYVDKQPVHQLKITSGMPYPLIGAPGFHFPGAFAGCYVGRMITREYGSWLNESFKGEKIPTLSNVLDFSAKNLAVPLKFDNVWNKFPDDIRAKFLCEIAERGERVNVGFTCSTLEALREAANAMPTAALHYDGIDVSEGTLKRVAEIAQGHKLVIWLCYDTPATKWYKGERASVELCDRVRKYGEVGIWLLAEREELDIAINKFHADYVETNGKLKPWWIK